MESAVAIQRERGQVEDLELARQSQAFCHIHVHEMSDGRGMERRQAGMLQPAGTTARLAEEHQRQPRQAGQRVVEVEFVEIQPRHT